MGKCDCTISHRVNGDGCRYCQPQEYIDRLSDWLDEARAEIVALAKGKEDLEQRIVETENGLRWACNVYMVDDDYTGDLRKERLERAVKYAMKKGNLKKQAEARGSDD